MGIVESFINGRLPRVTLREIGLIPNDISRAAENIVKLNAYMDNNTDKVIYCDAATYYVNDTIIVTPNNELVGEFSTLFRLTATDKDAMFVSPSAYVDRVRVMVPTGHRMAGVIVGHGDYARWRVADRRYQGVNDVFIIAESIDNTSTGLQFDAPNDCNVTNFRVKVTTMRCQYGCRVIKSGSGWPNGVFITIEVLDCEYGILNQGNGNAFHHIIQTTARTKVGIIEEGHSNVYIGKVWDCRPGQLVVATGHNSHSNNFLGDRYDQAIMQDYVKDNGYNNYFAGDSTAIKTGLVRPVGAYAYTADDYSTHRSYGFSVGNGIVDDYLANADKWCIINHADGAGVVGGNLANVFRNESCGIAYNDTDSTTPIVIELILPVAVGGVARLGLGFPLGCQPKNAKIETASTDAGAYVTWINVTNNKQPVISAMRNAYGSEVKKIRITLSEGIYHATLNTTSRIRLSNIFMFVNGVEGRFYLPRKGGLMYGDLDMNTSGLIAGKVASLPTAGVTHRGKVLRIEGGEGVADAFYLCRKKADDTYEWKQLDL